MVAARSTAPPIPIKSKPVQPNSGPLGDESMKPSDTNTQPNTKSRQIGELRNVFFTCATSGSLSTPGCLKKDNFANGVYLLGEQVPSPGNVSWHITLQ